jgi:putative ABC transport system permease protein
MRVIDQAELAFGAIFANRLRSALTILGITVGIGAVTLLTAIGEGVRQFVLAEFTQFGTNIAAIVPGKANTFGTSGATISTVRPLTVDDASALLRLENIDGVVPVIQGNARVEYEGRERRTTIIGVGADMPKVWKFGVAVGRFLPNDEFHHARSFAVLGSKMRDELFGNTNPLGARIRVGSDRYRVLGVMESKGQMLGFDLDDTLFIPIGKATELFDRESVMEIDVIYDEEANVEQLANDIKRLLISRHRHEDFTLITQDQMLDVLGSILNILTAGVGALGGISLIVGAVGIFTIMTISVTERTAEVGLLRALGAQRTHVLGLFLAEAVVLGVIGGLIGIGTVVAIIDLVTLFAPNLPMRAAWPYMALALTLSILIGLAAGIIPALRAAQLDPQEALRAE